MHMKIVTEEIIAFHTSYGTGFMRTACVGLYHTGNPKRDTRQHSALRDGTTEARPNQSARITRADKAMTDQTSPAISSAVYSG